jgi:hypothetical protein
MHRIDGRAFQVDRQDCEVLSSRDIPEHCDKELRTDLVVSEVQVKILQLRQRREVKEVFKTVINPDLV